jgi:predicted deacylase
VHPGKFEPNQFTRNGKYALDLEFKAGDCELSIPLLLFRGTREGKVLVVMAGVHGDEYEGVRAILEISAALDPAQMAGDIIAVPVANATAFWAGQRTSPLDNKDLARSFPGDLSSGQTSALAHWLAHAVIARADLLLDLHSGGIKYTMPTMVGYDATNPRSRDAAQAFGAPTLWGHPVLPPGRTVSFAKQRGIPWLYTEARGAGRIDPQDLRVFREGILNLLKHLSILPGAPTLRPVEYHLYGDGNTDVSLKSKQRGFLMSSVEQLEKVKQGQELGRLVDLHGSTVETFLSPSEGLVAMVREFPVVEPDTQLYLVTGVAAQPD